MDGASRVLTRHGASRTRDLVTILRVGHSSEGRSTGMKVEGHVQTRTDCALEQRAS